MRFTCSWGTSGILLLLTILVFLTVSSVSSFRSRLGQCPNCSGQYSRFIDAVTGRCVDCWPCIECNDGMGPSVPCGSTVTVGTKIHCVQCVEGQNFSDSSGLDQCQPCGVCSGKHERVLSKCNIESDVKCGCEAEFYRNQTTNECLPSVGSGGIKSLFTLLRTSSLVTSSSSYSHVTTTPLLPGITKSTPVPSRMQQIRATSTSASGLEKHERTSTVHVIDNYDKTVNNDNTHGSSNMKTEIIILIIVLSTACISLLICMSLLYHKLRMSRTCQLNNDPRSQVRFSTLLKQGDEQGRPLCIEGINSRKSSVVNELMGNAHQISCEKVDSIPDSEDIRRNVDSAHQDGGIETKTSSDQPDSRTEAVLKGIPSSLEGEPRKNITKGHQSSDFLEADQDELAIVSVDETIVPSDHLDLPNEMMPMPSVNTFNVLLTFNQGSIQQTSSDSSQIQRGTAAVSPFAECTSCGNNSVIPASYSGMHMANQGSVCGLSSVASAVQPIEENRGYSTDIRCVPSPVIQDICMLLDIERVTDGKDYRMLGSELGLKPLQIRFLKQQCIMSSTCNSPSYVLLMDVFSALPKSGTLGHLISILKKMERHDVIKDINEWVGSQNCTQVAQAYLE